MAKDSQSEITIDDLALMVQQGFLESRADLNTVRDELKGDIATLRQEIDERFEEVDSRFNRIEGMLRPTIDMVDDHSVRIKRLEKHVV